MMVRFEIDGMQYRATGVTYAPEEPAVLWPEDDAMEGCDAEVDWDELQVLRDGMWFTIPFDQVLANSTMEKLLEHFENADD